MRHPAHEPAEPIISQPAFTIVQAAIAAAEASIARATAKIAALKAEISKVNAKTAALDIAIPHITAKMAALNASTPTKVKIEPAVESGAAEVITADHRSSVSSSLQGPASSSVCT